MAPVAVFKAVELPTGLGPGDHICWGFDGDRAFADAATAFLREGVDRGELLMYVRPKPFADLASDLDGLPGRDRLIDRGQLVLQSLDQLYAVDEVHHETQAEQFRAKAEDAIGNGYAGLRAASDLTLIALDAARWSELRAFELRADAVIGQTPITGMCGYDETRVHPDRLGALSAVHPLRHRRGAPGTFAVNVVGQVISVSGEVDLSCVDDLAAVLVAVEDLTDGPVMVDLHRLDFVDVGGARVLARFVADLGGAGRTVQFRGSRRNAQRLLRFFDLDGRQAT